MITTKGSADHFHSAVLTAAVGGRKVHPPTPPIVTCGTERHSYPPLTAHRSDGLRLLDSHRGLTLAAPRLSRLFSGATFKTADSDGVRMPQTGDHVGADLIDPLTEIDGIGENRARAIVDVLADEGVFEDDANTAEIEAAVDELDGIIAALLADATAASTRSRLNRAQEQILDLRVLA